MATLFCCETRKPRSYRRWRRYRRRCRYRRVLDQLLIQPRFDPLKHAEISLLNRLVHAGDQLDVLLLDQVLDALKSLIDFDYFRVIDYLSNYNRIVWVRINRL